MRFLFVYQDYSVQARQLLDDLSVDDVTLILVRKRAVAPTSDEIALFESHPGADAAACEINRKYRRAASSFVNFCCEPKKFRFEDQQLRDWLVPKGRVAVIWSSPSVSFLAAAKIAPKLIVPPEVLRFADEMAEHRWKFAALAANLLTRVANGDHQGPLRQVKATEGFDFAQNGPVSYKYKVNRGSEVKEGLSEWHFKEGDKTTRESAARVYFDRVSFVDGTCVVVLYVGPHPKNGSYTIDIDVSMP